MPRNQYLHYYEKYTEPHKDPEKPEKPEKIKRIYNNYNACKNCNTRTKCCASLQTHKTITEYGSEMQKAMPHKLEKQEYKDEYIKSSIVESPFRISKEQLQLKNK